MGRAVSEFDPGRIMAFDRADEGIPPSARNGHLDQQRGRNITAEIDREILGRRLPFPAVTTRGGVQNPTAIRHGSASAVS